uniref:Glycosyltransferase n=1 Tax=Kalanchoe fedtschenkoi TaxID=63787 RepID=A0A7N0RGZ0_KALFE
MWSWPTLRKRCQHQDDLLPCFARPPTTLPTYTSLHNMIKLQSQSWTEDIFSTDSKSRLSWPGVGHLTSTVEIAKILLSRDHRLSITFLIIHPPNNGPSVSSITSSMIYDRLHYLDVPKEESDSIVSINGFMESKKPAVRKIVSELTESQSVSGPRLAGFVIDMFCTAMIDVATELGVPSYAYYTSGASFLALLLHVQKLCDYEGLDVADFKDSDEELSLPGFSNKIPARLLPSAAFDKERGFSKAFNRMARELRRTEGILVNSFIELESHAVQSMGLDPSVPPIYSVGPVVNTNSRTDFIKLDQETEITEWLDCHPPASVVFLCFGSMGAFGSDQVKEIARGLETSGLRFLWSLRRPPSSQTLFAPTEDYEDFSKVLPEGFLERTAGVGQVIGWAPQTAVLGHPSVGGFVSHCGWNSILESLWFGVPLATWPLYAEQQFNAFEAVKETGIGVEISLDYRIEMGKPGSDKAVLVRAEQIARGIRQVMEKESEVRKKVKLMMEKCREAVVQGGSSYNYLQQFMKDLRKNIGMPLETS